MSRPECPNCGVPLPKLEPPEPITDRISTVVAYVLVFAVIGALLVGFVVGVLAFVRWAL